ncbi:chitobiase/beta-hexosaminidase C-terminal domain-containing protein [Alloacidobacterium dinghuense]|uniref:Chitobiase/beta-hexosaminidase C-terminal domain-containing protein n=1 Tax=Alloacidobacterium dinghuense TaxID=2763107 RepID=A0A7G8BKK4_9BACT|nr:chitobiase/beta-hexosaminidase C-terminal domain-containing protein [Alloacidobacterium dinghuense]QNI33074.1 chitobiase/beta-hexosaminidase C-terminal domain-containing protein [Alloacidobacterium dinghuense]
MPAVRSFAIILLLALSTGISSLAVTLSAPQFSVPGGTYQAYKSVTITDATPGATIYYTVSGVTPTIYSTQYTGPISVNRNMTLKAIAAVPGGPVSAVATATYSFVPPVAPVFSTPGGTYQAYKSIAISDATAGAAIYYTVSGVTPTVYSTQYTGSITVNRNMTLKAIAAVPGGPAGPVTSATYAFVSAVAPTFSEAAGVYQGPQSIAISNATSGATTYYTVTGVTPTTSSTRYTGPITVTSNMTLKAVAAVPGGPAGPVSTVSYTIVPHSTPVRTPNSSAAFFAMNIDYLTAGTPWPELPIHTIRLWDTGTKWGNLNPSATTYTWKNLDAQVSMARANGSQLLYTFGGVPPWALPKNVPIQSITRSGGFVTVTTSSAHGMYYNPTQPASSQSQVTLAGVSNSSFNGTFYLTGTPTANTFTYAQSGADSSSSAGTISAVCGGAYAPSMCAEAPASLSLWDEFVTQLISHLGAGAIQYWEFWNEANDPFYWQGDPKTLVAMASDAKSIIRAVDPAAVFLSPSTTGNYETQAECAGSVQYCGTTWLDNWLGLGGNSIINIVSFHGYPTIGGAPEPIQGSVYQLQAVAAKHENGSLPIWDTESSWRNNTNLPEESDQAGWLARQLLLEQSIGVQRTFWYAYDNPAWGTLWTSTGGLNTAGEGYQRVSQWITGVTVSQPCAEIPASPTTFVCSFTRADGYVAQAVWNTAGTANYTVPSQYVQYHDLTGAVHGVIGGSVEISKDPILLENESVF